MVKSEIRLIGQGARPIIEIAGMPHPVIFERPLQLAPGYQISTYKFEDEKGEEADGCQLIIAPHQSTRSILVANDTTFNDVVLGGRGWFHAVDPNGEIVTYASNGGRYSIEVEYKKEWLVTWIAGRQGLNVLSLNRPLFTEAAETNVEVGSTEVNGKVIPAWYWRVYKRLKASI